MKRRLHRIRSRAHAALVKRRKWRKPGPVAVVDTMRLLTIREVAAALKCREHTLAVRLDHLQAHGVRVIGEKIDEKTLAEFLQNRPRDRERRDARRFEIVVPPAIDVPIADAPAA